MSHYVDADRLKAEIERRRLSNRYIDTEGYESELLDIITSLQQEQPELPGYNKALLEVKSKVDELYEEASIGLNEYDSGLYNGIAETCMKLRGFIKARLDSDEQPEVDLEKELYDYISSGEYLNTRGNGSLLIARHFYGLRNRALEEAARHVYESWMGGTMDEVRRDMVELGKVLNARKEE